MNFDAPIKVEFLNEEILEDAVTNESVIPYFTEISKIYLGYRQCYKTDPTGELTISTEDAFATMRKVCDYYDEYNKSHPNHQWHQPFTDMYDGGVINWLKYWKMCLFISKHMNHESPLEHGSMTVRIQCSRDCSHQWVRSRVASHSQSSQRYIKITDPEFICPPSIRSNPIAYQEFQQYLGQMQYVAETMRRVGIPNEDIRAIFPNAITTHIVTTANFREWQHILEERCCTRAQWQIRDIATQIRDHLQFHIPFIFHGSKCERLGYCPEGKGCCGKMSIKEVVIDPVN